MEPPYDVNNPLFTAYRLSPLHNIADTGVRATGYDNQSLTRPECQRRIVKEMILSSRSIGHNYFSSFRIDLLEPEIPFNLTQKDKVFGKMSRDRGGAHIKEP